MYIPRKLEIELVKNAVARVFGKAPVFIFPPSEETPAWHIILLTRIAEITTQLNVGGFTGVQKVSGSKTSYIETYLVSFEGYPQPNHPDISRRIQFHDGGCGTVLDYVAHNPDISRVSPAWLILADTEKYLSPSGWYSSAKFNFVEEAVSAQVS